MRHSSLAAARIKSGARGAIGSRPVSRRRYVTHCRGIALPSGPQVRLPYSYIGPKTGSGFTLVEFMLVLLVSALLVAIAIPSYRGYVLRAQTSSVIATLGQIEMLVSRYEPQNNGALPPDLAAINMDTTLDPWGNPYYYHTTVEGTGNGVGRKDKNLHPINTDYDLYSSGPDGQSVAPLTAKPSKDDIIRASNGTYLGVAANY